MPIFRWILTATISFPLMPAVATTVDFESGGGPFTGNGHVLTSNQGGCPGNALFRPQSGCKALVVGINPFSPPTTGTASVIFDVPGGFSKLSFLYGLRASSNVVMTVYSGAGGTGNVVGNQAGFSGVACDEGVLRFCEWYVGGFNGGGRSVKFTAVDQRLMLDDMVFAPAEPEIPVSADTTPPRNCSARYTAGNPIEPLTGNKTQSIDLGITLAGTPLTLNYDSNRASRPDRPAGRLPGFGGGWTASWLRSVVSFTSAGNGVQPPFGSFRPEGREETFMVARPNTVPPAWQARSGDSDYVQLLDATNLNYKGIHEGLVERNVYSDGAWRPAKFAAVAGGALHVTTSGATHPLMLGGQQVAGLPLELSDDFGRKVTFQYAVIPATGDPYADAKVVSMTLPGVGSINFGYSPSGNLTSITWPDASVLGLAYDDPVSTNSRLWTGVIDEDNKRFSTFSYDASGRAVATEHAGGVNAHAVTYGTAPELVRTTTLDPVTQRVIATYRRMVPSGVVVTGPNGSPTQVGGAQVANYSSPVSFSQPAGSGCAASTSTQDFDAKGNLAWKEDFKGNRTCYAHDQGRNLETSRVEGLAAGSACAGVLATNATLPAVARKVSTSWHPLWRKQAQVAEPRRRTTFVYNGQPDPFNGGATASCAPASATLPDGSPLVVLCKQVEQATTDTNGSQGLAATADANVPSRVLQWTYNQHGQVLTAKDPLNNTTTLAYYSDTTADHVQGDLYTVTNAKQQTTTFTKYNPTGQWLEMKDANNIVTTRTFDLRQRLKSVSTAGATTSYDYWPTGLLKLVTLADGSSVNYGYDDAHRLTSITDSLGNSITYTLDNSGNRTGEEVKDPSGILAKALTRVPDALNRLQQVTGRQ